MLLLLVVAAAGMIHGYVMLLSNNENLKFRGKRANIYV